MNTLNHIKEATASDIPAMHAIRIAVKENKLPNPDMITPADYKSFILDRGKGWIYVQDGLITGFTIVDLVEHNVWALFVHPAYEAQGIGTGLHNQMVEWYFSQSDHILWLGTAFNTRAEKFYRKLGWKEAGYNGAKEIKFEMDYRTWQQLHQK